MARLPVKSFSDKVYAAVIQIPKGRVATYKEIARAIGRPAAVRAVGSALNKNPFAPRVPCHRVVRSDSRIGGFARGTLIKERLLKREGIRVDDGKIIDIERSIFKFG